MQEILSPSFCEQSTNLLACQCQNFPRT